MKTRTALAVVLACTLTSLPAQEYRPQELEYAGYQYPQYRKAARSHLKRSWFAFDSVSKSIQVLRRERQTANENWAEQEQVLTVSYEPVDVRSVKSSNDEIEFIYVCGVDGPSSSVIEEWEFTYPLSTGGAGVPGGGAGGYVPLDQRPLPSVSRTVILSDPSLGVISSFDIDPERRYIHFLNHPYRELRRLSLQTSETVLVLMPASQPFLSNARSLEVLEHKTEGRQLHLYQNYLWEKHHNAADLLIMYDTQNNGQYQLDEVISPEQWDARNYSGDVWNLLYKQ